MNKANNRICEVPLASESKDQSYNNESKLKEKTFRFLLRKQIGKFCDFHAPGANVINIFFRNADSFSINTEKIPR